MEQWKIQDALSSIQAQMQEIERISLRAAFDQRVSGDTKRKVQMLCVDVARRFAALPEHK